MLHRCPWPFRSSASSTARLVTPRPTPVSTTCCGRRCRARHQAARANAGSASSQPP